VCAAGRSAGDLVEDIQERMRNDPERELAVAVEEQRKITRLRLRALVDGGDP
jgi:2-oxo-4-hydroxy-4-carboxy--5-ureidoimidazoline (OHCU) decarboxylase